MKQKIKEDLQRYLMSQKHIDEMMPSCPDVEELWKKIGMSYLPDGIREFQSYPVSSLGWMMYIGMAIASYWDSEWEIYSKIEDLYVYMRNKRGYDYMDEYIREEVLVLSKEDSKRIENLVGECASRTNSLLCHANIEPGTQQAFQAYVDALEQLYLFGMAIQLKRMGYKMMKCD